MKSLEELRVIREKMQGEVAFRSEHEELIKGLKKAEELQFDTKYRYHVLVCGGTGCTSSGSQRIREKLAEEIEKQGIEEEVCVIKLFWPVCAGTDHDRVSGRCILFHGKRR